MPLPQPPHFGPKPAPKPAPPPKPAQELFEEGRKFHLSSSLVRSRLGSTWRSIVVPSFHAGNFADDM